ncbi:MAG TPA: tetratricopeptide repeat protein [Nitrospiria bacterium]|nr:tetratricopeptide repeat protein [Nitrospiria bacterium]
MLILLPLLWADIAAAEEQEDTTLFYQGQSLMEKKHPEEAATKFNELLKKYPKSNIRDLTFYWLGRAYLDLHRTSEAETILHELQREFPDSPLVPKLNKEVAARSLKPQPPVAEAVPPATAPKPSKPAPPPKVAEKSVSPPASPSTKSAAPSPAPKPPAPRKTKPPVVQTLPVPAGGSSKGFSLTITQVADLKVEAKEVQLSVYPGESGAIPFQVTNTGNAEDSFTFRTTLPPEYQPVFYLDSNGNGQIDASERAVQATPSLDVNRSASAVLVLHLPPTTPDGQRQEFEILVSSSFDPNISQLVKAAVNSKGPLIRADFKADKERVKPGDRLSYTLVLQNTGSAEAREVKFQYTYHPNLIFLSAQPTPNIVEQASRTLAWTLDNFPSQSSKRMEVRFKVGDEATAGQEITNRGGLEMAAGGEPMLLSSPLVTVEQVAMVNLEGSREEMTVTPGDILDLPYLVKNMGNGADSFSLRLEGDEAVEGLVYTDQNNDGRYESGEPVLTETPPLGSREAFPVMVHVTVPVRQADGQKLEARLMAQSKLDRAVSARTTKVFHYTLPIVTVSTQQGARDSIPGGIISYQLTAINSGSGIARNVVITDLLPTELEYVNSDPQPSDRPEGGLVWQVTELAPNQKKVFVVNVKTKTGLRAGTVIQKDTRVRYSDLNGNRYE